MQKCRQSLVALVLLGSPAVMVLSEQLPGVQTLSTLSDSTATGGRRQREHTTASVSAHGDVSVMRSERSHAILNTAARREGFVPYECADDGQSCQCTGTLVFGQKFTDGSSQGRASRQVDADTMLSNYHVATIVQGQARCSKETFEGEDPAPGSKKYCFCFSGTTSIVSGSGTPESTDESGVSHSLDESGVISGSLASLTPIADTRLAPPQEKMRIEPWMCAEEGQVCKCTGTVVYGKKYVDGNGVRSDQLVDQVGICQHKHLSRATTNKKCELYTFHPDPDPLPDHTKYCYCFEGDTFAQECHITTTTALDWRHGITR